MLDWWSKEGKGSPIISERGRDLPRTCWPLATVEVLGLDEMGEDMVSDNELGASAVGRDGDILWGLNTATLCNLVRISHVCLKRVQKLFIPAQQAPSFFHLLLPELFLICASLKPLPSMSVMLTKFESKSNRVKGNDFIWTPVPTC